jgi:hypothetical protein
LFDFVEKKGLKVRNTKRMEHKYKSDAFAGSDVAKLKNDAVNDVQKASIEFSVLLMLHFYKPRFLNSFQKLTKIEKSFVVFPTLSNSK